MTLAVDAVLAGLIALFAGQAFAQEQGKIEATEPPSILYAVEIRTGPAWDHAKPANEQAQFREHSAHLKKLREQGSLVMGARYSDKGLVILQASSEQEARGLRLRPS